ELVLTIDDTKLTGYLQTNFDDVMSLFVAQGGTSTSTLSYIGLSRDTEEGEYTVHINRAATRGTETGNVDLSSGGAGETLTITQGNSAAAITITSGMTLADIKNEINAELDTKYTETLVGLEQLYADSTQTNKITSETTWNSVYDSVGTSAGLQNNDVIEFSGTSRSGAAISGSYTISDITSDTVQGLLSATEDAFSREVTATINTDGKIVLTDKNVGNSQLSLVITEPASLDFGTVETTNTGGQEGRYSMAITATDDGSNHLVLRSDDYGSTSFTISQDTSDGNYDHIVYTTTSNTTDSTSGTVYITEDTAWSDIYGASLVVTDEIDITGFARDGTTPISGTYAISSLSDPVSGLLSAIEAAYSAQGTTVDAFIRDGKIYVEDQDDVLNNGASAIALTLTPDYVGGGSGLTLGTFDQTTERDLDLGLLNGAVTGQAVAGTIGGEAATGGGQVLSGNDGNTNTDGLSIRYSGTANDTDVGTITLTLGVAELFERALYGITDSIDGYAAFKQTSLQNSIDSYETQIENMEARLDRKMEMMITRFVAMELALSKLQNQSSWLTGQISASYSGWGWL
ncbi:MAG: flagellar filament capping protein FliD, partial [Deltaproteobacteria bacterium]|nr:flagellar filament capping protein FliD [Deltaproteobacteria bacterium]